MISTQAQALTARTYYTNRISMKYFIGLIMAIALMPSAYAAYFEQGDGYSSTMTRGVTVGAHVAPAQSTGGGNGDYIKYGYNETRTYCEALLKKNGEGLYLGINVKYIQYSGEYCYYYGRTGVPGKTNAGKSGPWTWTYSNELTGNACSMAARKAWTRFTKDNPEWHVGLSGPQAAVQDRVTACKDAYIR